MKRLAALVPLLSACGGPPEAKPDDLIECALDGAAKFERVCRVERASNDSGLLLTIRSPGGGFRRLLVTGDGRGVVAADGAEAATVIPLGANLIEVAVGGDRYLLPATVR